MTEESETPLGVKMLADHLVKVKLQYEGIFKFILVIGIRENQRSSRTYSWNRERESRVAAALQSNGR